MKIPNWISKILRRATIRGLNPRLFSTQYRVQLVREGSRPVMKCSIDNSVDAHFLARKIIKGQGQSDRSQFLVLMLTDKREVIGFNIAATGPGGSVLAGPSDVFKPAILTNAGAIVLCHTQPNGDVLPSKDAFANSRRIVWAAYLLGIRVIDHLVISTVDDGYFSFAEHGFIKRFYESLRGSKTSAADSEEAIIAPESSTLH